MALLTTVVLLGVAVLQAPGHRPRLAHHSHQGSLSAVLATLGWTALLLVPIVAWLLPPRLRRQRQQARAATVGATWAPGRIVRLEPIWPARPRFPLDQLARIQFALVDEGAGAVIGAVELAFLPTTFDPRGDHVLLGGDRIGDDVALRPVDGRPTLLPTSPLLAIPPGLLPHALAQTAAAMVGWGEGHPGERDGTALAANAVAVRRIQRVTRAGTLAATLIVVLIAMGVGGQGLSPVTGAAVVGVGVGWAVALRATYVLAWRWAATPLARVLEVRFGVSPGDGPALARGLLLAGYGAKVPILVLPESKLLEIVARAQPLAA